MQLNVVCAVAAAAIILTACNRSETPEEVVRDVEKARAEGVRDVADARADAQQANADADKQVADAIADHDEDEVIEQARDANETFDRGKAKILIAQAEADHKVALEKCDALQGQDTAQKDCKDNADRALDQAKQAAQANR